MDFSLSLPSRMYYRASMIAAEKEDAVWRYAHDCAHEETRAQALVGGHAGARLGFRFSAVRDAGWDGAREAIAAEDEAAPAARVVAARAASALAAEFVMLN